MIAQRVDNKTLVTLSLLSGIYLVGRRAINQPHANLRLIDLIN